MIKFGGYEERRRKVGKPKVCEDCLWENVFCALRAALQRHIAERSTGRFNADKFDFCSNKVPRERQQVGVESMKICVR